MHVLILIFWAFLIFDSGQSSSCNPDSAYNKNEIVERLESCKRAVDQFECIAEFGVKPANLLLNFGFSVGFIERFGMRLNVSSNAHRLYKNCTDSLLDAMPDFFSTEIRKLLDSNYYDQQCFNRDQICSLNKDFLYSFICLARQHCSMYFSDAYYALVYAHQQLTLETNAQLNCFEHSEHDLRPELYTKGYVLKRGNVLSRHFCRNVPNPPRRVVHETNADEFKITIGLEYSW